MIAYVRMRKSFQVLLILDLKVLWEKCKIEWHQIIDRPFTLQLFYLLLKSHDYTVIINA